MQRNVNKQLKLVFTAGETLTDGDTAGFTGRCLVMSGAADDTVLLPSASTDVPSAILTVGGASGTEVEVERIQPGLEYLIRANGNIARGAYVEPILTTANFGKFQTYDSGLKKFQALRSAVAGDLFPALAL